MPHVKKCFVKCNDYMRKSQQVWDHIFLHCACEDMPVCLHVTFPHSLLPDILLICTQFPFLNGLSAVLSNEVLIVLLMLLYVCALMYITLSS